MDWQKGGAVFVIQYRNGLMYSETPEEQGLADGDRMLRIFTDYEEARRYRDAIEEYVGQELVVSAFSIEDLWWPLKRLGQVRVEVCTMPEAAWPVAISTLWRPGQELH